MDGVSAVASIGQLAGGAFKLLEILNSIRQGGKQRLRLLTAISSFWTVLQSAQSQLINDDGEAVEQSSTTFQALQGTNGAFSQAEAVLEELKKRLEKRKGIEKLVQDLQWPFSKSDVDASMAQLKQLTEAVNLALASLTHSAVLQTQKEIQYISSATLDQELKSIWSWLSPLDFHKQQVSPHFTAML